MNVCILIPVYNEAQGIGQLVGELKGSSFDVIVVDDGSDDNSGSIAGNNGALVLTHKKKMGKGASLREGFNYICEHKYDGVITMDGDRQHDVSDLDKFVTKAKDDPSSIITGNRMGNSKGMPFVRLAVNKVMSSIVSFLCKQRIPDTQCGYRYIGSEILRKIKLSSGDFEIESEVLIKGSRQGFKIYSVPIKTIYRNESSRINPFVDTIRFLVYIAKEAWISRS